MGVVWKSIKPKLWECPEKSQNWPKRFLTKKMRAAECCMEQGIHDNFGCDLSGLESILDPRCPEKKSQKLWRFAIGKYWVWRGGLGGGSPPRAQAKPERVWERERERCQLKTQHKPPSTWWAHTSINETRTSISQDVSGVTHGPSIYNIYIIYIIYI